MEHHGKDEIKSLFGCHVAPEKTEQLEEIKNENEKKMKEMLKVEEVEGEEGNLNAVSQLVDLIVEYHKRHRSLNAHDDDHTAELKDKFHYQEGTSSSQYFDSDPSSKEKVEKASGIIKQQIEAANDKGKKFCEDLQARDDQLKDENSTLQDGKEQRIIQGLQLEQEEQLEEKNLKLQLVQNEQREKNLELERISEEKEDNQCKLTLQIAGEKQEAEGRKRKSLAMKKNIGPSSMVVNLRRALKKSYEEHRQLLDQAKEEYLTNLGLKDKVIDSGIELAESMKEEIIIRSEAITRLQDEINTAEFNLQISSNNLHVTEQLLAKNKEVYKKQEKFQQECKELKEQNSKSSNGIDTAQKDLIEIRSLVEKERNSLSASRLVVALREFQENDRSFEIRILEVSKALRTVMNLLIDTNGNIEKLKKRLNVKEDEVLKIEEEKK